MIDGFRGARDRCDVFWWWEGVQLTALTGVTTTMIVKVNKPIRHCLWATARPRAWVYIAFIMI